MKYKTIEEMKNELDILTKQREDLTKMIREEEEKEEAARKQKLEAEKEERREYVCALIEDAERALQEYINDYGSFELDHNDTDDFFSSFLHHLFLF